jgi:glutamate racemase
MDRCKGIGIFDSGVGGLTVASQVSRLLPGEKIFYYGDTAHVPYGDKTEEQIIGYVHDIVEFLQEEGVKAIVMACNTSSALVLPKIKDKMTIPTLGVIEFASRMALEASAGERIGVVANPLTVNSGAYKKTIKGISLNGTLVYQNACPRWVPLVEAGKTSGEEVERIVREDLEPLMAANIDTLILGCTHYPYFTPVIRKIMGEDVAIIDPAEALARTLRKILEDSNLLANESNPGHRFYVSGDPEEFRIKGEMFFGKKIPEVKKACLSRHYALSSLSFT